MTLLRWTVHLEQLTLMSYFWVLTEIQRKHKTYARHWSFFLFFLQTDSLSPFQCFSYHLSLIHFTSMWCPGTDISASLSVSLDVYFPISCLILHFFRSLHFLHSHRYWSWVITSWEKSLHLWPSPAWPHCCDCTWITTFSSISIPELYSSCLASGCYVCKETDSISCTRTHCAHCLCWILITFLLLGELFFIKFVL